MIISFFCIETYENGGGIYIYASRFFSTQFSPRFHKYTVLWIQTWNLLNRGDMPVGYRLRTAYINHKQLGDHWQCIYIHAKHNYSFLSFFLLWLTGFVVEKSNESRRKLKDLLTNKKIFFFCFWFFFHFQVFLFQWKIENVFIY